MLPTQAVKRRENRMKTSNWTRLIIFVLAGCTVAAFAAPAWGKSGDVTLRRDGSKAVPFVADPGKGSGASVSVPALRRDGSKAVPFVADLGPEAAATEGGFDWGDAGIGAGAALVLTTMGLGGAHA